MLDSLNAAVGALDSDVSFLGDNLEAGKSRVAEGYSDDKDKGADGLDGVSSQELHKVSKKVDSLEEGFGSVKSMLEDVLGYVKGISESGERGVAVGTPAVEKVATNKSFEVEDDSGETLPGEDSGESQVSGYSVVQDLKPNSVDTRSYDTEEESEEKPAEVDPEAASLLDKMADSIGADMW